MVTNSKPFKIPGCPSVIIMGHSGTGRTAYCNSVSAGSLAEDPALRNAPGNAGSCSRDPAGTHKVSVRNYYGTLRDRTDNLLQFRLRRVSRRGPCAA